MEVDRIEGACHRASVLSWGSASSLLAPALQVQQCAYPMARITDEIGGPAKVVVVMWKETVGPDMYASSRIGRHFLTLHRCTIGAYVAKDNNKVT